MAPVALTQAQIRRMLCVHTCNQLLNILNILKVGQPNKLLKIYLVIVIHVEEFKHVA